MAISSELQTRIKAMASQLRREIFAPSGLPPQGTKFTELEDRACEVGDAMTRALLETTLQEQQAAVPSGPVECGLCGRSAVEDELEPRLVTTRRGDVAWQERKYYCKHCRKAFFPSVARLGHSSG
jgi:hypothetical protein